MKTDRELKFEQPRSHSHSVFSTEYRTELRLEEMKKHRVQQAIADEESRIIQEEINRKEMERENFKALLKQAKRWHKVGKPVTLTIPRRFKLISQGWN